MERRNLSQFYIRHGKESICFEELPEAKQKEILDTYSVKELKDTILGLSKVINFLGEKFDIINKP